MFSQKRISNLPLKFGFHFKLLIWRIRITFFQNRGSRIILLGCQATISIHMTYRFVLKIYNESIACVKMVSKGLVISKKCSKDICNSPRHCNSKLDSLSFHDSELILPDYLFQQHPSNYHQT